MHAGRILPRASDLRPECDQFDPDEKATRQVGYFNGRTSRRCLAEMGSVDFVDRGVIVDVLEENGGLDHRVSGQPQVPENRHDVVHDLLRLICHVQSSEPIIGSGIEGYLTGKENESVGLGHR